MADINLLTDTNTSTFGLSKDLIAPVSIKIGYLQSNLGNSTNHLHPSSEKYSNPEIFKKVSGIVSNSELFVTIQLFDGPSQNPITVPIQTPYKTFSNNKRVWDQYLQLPINYNQISYKSYIRIKIWEIVDTEAVPFGIGCVSLFNKDNSSLRNGSQKVRIFDYDGTSGDIPVEYRSSSDLTFLEKKLISYENGDFEKNSWLDKMVLPKVEETRSNDRKKSQIYDEKEICPYYLYIEFPNFDMPVVFSDVTYRTTPFLVGLQAESFISNQDKQILANDINNPNVLINAVEIPLSSKHSIANVKVYDPDFQFAHPQQQQQQQQPLQQQQQQQQQTLDPIELKYHKLERHINNNPLLDKELKPSPQVRDELMRILQKPSNIELTDIEKNLIWKFRYYFSKNNLSPNENEQPNENRIATVVGSTKNTKFFFTKFLKSINWDNDYELNLVFNEIIPTYWTVDKIQIGDALELLGNYFNPYTLTSDTGNTGAAPSSNSNPLSKDLGGEESRLQKIIGYVSFLRKFAVDRLKLAPADELLLYLLQLVQALKYESLVFDSMEASSLSRNSSVSELKSPLATFLISKSIENENLGNFFYWYVKVENEDQLNKTGVQTNNNKLAIYSQVLNKYIEELKARSEARKLPNYKHLKRQIWFIKKLTNLVELLRSTFKKNEATSKKVQFLRDYLADSSNELLKFQDPFPLPLDPSVIICGCYPEESSVFKSSLAPLKITFKTIVNFHESDYKKKNFKYGKYPLMFKIGDDLRQDQLVIQIINLMDQLLKNENLDLRLTPYKILATSPIAGFIQFVPNETLDSVLANYGAVNPLDNGNSNNHSSIANNEIINNDNNNNEVVSTVNQATAANAISETQVPSNGILNYLRLHNDQVDFTDDFVSTVSDVDASATTNPPQRLQKHAISSDLGVNTYIMDNYVKSCAGYCVITYLLGVGDRHLDNLLLSPNGKFWHADFGYILGRDPKPFPPLMKLPIQVIVGMGGLNHENFNIFRNYCFITYTTLRKNSNLILNLFLLMLDANIPDIQIDPQRAIEKVQEKFCLEMSEEEAILHFQNLINDSVNAFLPVVIDRLHSLAQYWRA